MSQKRLHVMLVATFSLISFGYAVPGWAAKPTCPGHPSCGGGGNNDGSIQLGSGDDDWPADTGYDNSGDDTVLGGSGNDKIWIKESHGNEAMASLMTRVSTLARRTTTRRLRYSTLQDLC